MPNNPINTIDELLKIEKWILNQIENCEIENVMEMYCPNILIKTTLDLSEPGIPKIIREAIEAKFYTKDECES